ncbi:PAS domain S-box protein [Methanohalobium sp.]|uniref:PAS domain S-box protein n=1 Tax=Methanohalobium sp. TaxID=2837493 RepID=UPI0025EA6D44|nr:PAS domain S-box protein [Methanohalobium sp.]
MKLLQYFENKKFVITITLVLGLSIVVVESIIELFYPNIEPTTGLSVFDFLAHFIILPLFLLFGLVITKAMDEHKRLKQLIQSISNVNQLIIREKDINRLIQKTCNILTNTHIYESAWILLLDSNKNIISSAESRIGSKFNDFLKKYENGEPTQCIQDIFNQTDELLVVKSKNSNCSDCQLVGNESGYKALVSRLEHEGTLYGLLAVSGSDDVVSENSKELFHEVTNDISYALHNLESEKELVKNEQRHSTIVNDVLDNSRVGIFILDFSFHVVWINKVMEDYFGINREDVIGMDKRQLVKNRLKHIFEDSERFANKVLATYDDNSYVENFVCHVMPDENLQERWLEHWSQPIKSGLYTGGRIEHYYDITYKEKLEEELRNQIDFLEKVADTSPICITKVDKYGYIVYANHAAENVLGLSRSDIQGRTYDDVEWKITDIDGNHYPKDKLPFKLVQKYQEPIYDIRHGIEWPDGQRKLLSINSAPIFDKNYKFDGMVSAIEDITEKIKKKRELELSEQKFRSYIDNSPIGIFVVNNDGYYLDVNPAASYITGYTIDELLSMNLIYLHPPEVHNQIKQVYNDFLEKGKLSIELPFITKTGERRYFILDAVKLPDGKYIGFTTDITERKKVENELKESEERFRTVIEQAADAILAHDFDGNIVFANKLASEYLGYTKSELLSMNLSDIDPKVDDIKAFREKYWNNLSPHDSYRGETVHKCKDGSEFPVEVKMTLINLSGKPVILGFARDITVRKEAEEKLINAKLEAEAANQAKSELLANVSHELRTPLTSIIGFSDVMLKKKVGDLNDNQTLYLDKIHKSGQHLLDLINDILDLAKIESGKLELHREIISIPALLNDLKSKLYPFASKKGLFLDSEIDSNIEYIYADEIKLRQILYNLIYNAIKFTSEGSVTVTVKQKNDAYQFSIIDTGIGIPKDKQDEIFESFKQLDTGANRRYAGTGLGLALVKRLVEIHGGQIWVESGESSGTTFIFIIPSTKNKK